MSDERLVEMLGSLGYERMDRAADARARQRLEDEWADVQERRRSSWLRAFAPAVIAIGFVAVATFATLHSPGDSPLYGVRIAIEDAATNVYADPQDRIQYLLGLYEQRQAEAARLETIGSAASGGARRVETRTLATLQALLPRAPEDEQPPAASPNVPAPAIALSPSPTPADATPTPAAPPSTPRPSAVPTPTPLRTATPRPTPTATQKPTTTTTTTPTPSPIKSETVPVVLNGTVVDATGAPASQVCVSVVAGDCQARTTSAGIYKLTVAARLGQTVYVYAWIADPTGKITYKGATSVVVRGSTVQVPTIALHPY